MPAPKNSYILLLMPLAILAVLLSAPDSRGEEKSGLRIATVTVTQAENGDIVERVPISGSLVAREEVLINPQVSGYEIQSINADVGDKVSAGDVLVSLDSRPLEAQAAQARAEVNRAKASVLQAGSQINSAKANLVQAQAALDRTEQLRKSGNTSQANLDQAIAAQGTASANVSAAENGLAVAEAQLSQTLSQQDLAELNLERSQIKSPVSGIISSRMAKVGAIASSSGEPLFRIIKNGEIELEAEVIETALGSLSLEDVAQISVAGVGDIEGRVRLVAPTVDPVTRLGIVKIALPDNAGLRSGLFGSGWIITDERNSVTVPTGAVLVDNQKNFVLAVEGDKVIRKTVVPGLIWQERREIVSGITAGETVISKAGAFFSDGDTIKPVLETETGSGSNQ